MTRARSGVALALLTVALPVTAQDWRAGTARLDGKVMDAAGRALAGATVKLELPGRGGTSLRTDSKGKWAILGLTGGDWEVEVSSDGYVTRRVTASVTEQSRRPSLEVRLDKAAEAAAVTPEVASALASAEAADRAGRLAEARAEYERLRALRPDLSGRIDQQVGLTYVRERDYARAFEHLAKALAAEPASQPLRAAAVQAAFESGQPGKARELLAGSDPGALASADIAFNFGVGLLNAGATEEALPWLGRALTLDPAYVDGYYRRGLAYLQLGRTQECRADLAKVVELAPATPQGEMARKALAQVP
jgi:tetratricopeptide (TPR) repeat protein